MSNMTAIFETPINQIVSGKQDLVVVESKASVAKALLLMQQFGVLSLPVMNAAYDCKDPDSQKFLGIVDITDVLMYVAFGNFDEVRDDKSVTTEQLSGEKLSFVSVSDIIGAATKLQTGMFINGLFVMKETDTVQRALELSRGGVQRLVVDYGDEKYKLVSQMDLLRYFALLDESWMEDFVNKKVESVSSLQRSDEFNELCTMTSKESALTGFRRMLRNKADAVAVLNSDGKLLSTLSASDLRFLFERTGSLKGVLLPVTEFIELVHPRSAPRKQLKIRASDDLQTAIFKCVLGKVHRVWVVNDEDKPMACLRVQDMLDEVYDVARSLRT